ncbi:MAG: CsbD family protein [Phototrophicaceae bacterium]
MNIEMLKAQWTDFRGQAKERWGELTNDDLMEVEGEFDQLVAKVQERYGIAKAEAREEVNEWLSNIRQTTH